MIYKSKYLNHTIVMSPTRKVMENGQLVVIPGKKIEFKAGTYETDKKEEISFLRKLKFFNVDVFEIDPVKLKKQKEIAAVSSEVTKLVQEKKVNLEDLQKFLKKAKLNSPKQDFSPDLPEPNEESTQRKVNL